jgi:hypothetical protein
LVIVPQEFIKIDLKLARRLQSKPNLSDTGNKSNCSEDHEQTHGARCAGAINRLLQLHEMALPHGFVGSFLFVLTRNEQENLHRLASTNKRGSSLDPYHEGRRHSGGSDALRPNGSLAGYFNSGTPLFRGFGHELRCRNHEFANRLTVSDSDTKNQITIPVVAANGADQQEPGAVAAEASEEVRPGLAPGRELYDQVLPRMRGGGGRKVEA